MTKSDINGGKIATTANCIRFCSRISVFAGQSCKEVDIASKQLQSRRGIGEVTTPSFNLVRKETRKREIDI